LQLASWAAVAGQLADLNKTTFSEGEEILQGNFLSFTLIQFACMKIILKTRFHENESYARPNNNFSNYYRI